MRPRPARARRSRPLAPLAWVLWSVAAVTVLAVSATLWTLRQPAPDLRSYPGRLRPLTDPAGVVLPAGVPLQTVLVAEGDRVRAGQTLATLDGPTIALRLAEVEVDILERQILRDCLIDGSGLDLDGEPDPRVLPAVAEADDIQARDMAIRLRGALADCAADRRALAERRRGLDEAHRLLTTRRDLLTKRMALALAAAATSPPETAVEVGPTPAPMPVPLLPLPQPRRLDASRVPLRAAPDRIPLRLGPPETPVEAPTASVPSRLLVVPEAEFGGLPEMAGADPTDQAQTVIALALARSVVDERRLEVRRQAETEALEARRALLAHSRTLGTEVRELQALRSLLIRYAEAPRLTAPQTGTVVRIRGARPGVVFPKTAELMSLAPEGDLQLEAMILMPPAAAARVLPGDPVAIRLPSQLAPGGPLEGQIGGPTPLPPPLGGLDRVALAVEVADPTALADAGRGLALIGRGTSAEIEVHLAEASLATLLGRSAGGLIQQTWLGRTLARPDAAMALSTPPPPEAWGRVTPVAPMADHTVQGLDPATATDTPIDPIGPGAAPH